MYCFKKHLLEELSSIAKQKETKERELDSELEETTRRVLTVKSELKEEEVKLEDEKRKKREAEKELDEKNKLVVDLERHYENDMRFWDEAFLKLKQTSRLLIQNFTKMLEEGVN